MNKIKLLNLFALLSLLSWACQKSTHSLISPTAPSTPASNPPNDFFSKYYDITSLAVSDSFASPKILGAVEDQSLEEISGIAQSYSVVNGIWMEEDSGNENKIYLLSTNGKTLANYQMTGIQDRDWEDLSISSGPIPNVPYIYLAEIGDNNHIYDTKYIYRFPEPSTLNKTFPFNDQITTVDKISFQYPYGIKNAEAIMIDPVTHDIYIISKEDEAVIYVARYPQLLDKVFTIIKLGTIPMTEVTAADISADGNEVLIKNYNQILYWKKNANESITDLLQETPLRAPYVPELKGESICWASDGSGYFVTSEGLNQPIYFYPRK